MNYRDLFKSASTRAAPLLAKHDLRSQTGTWRGAIFLKLQKPSWSEPGEASFGKGIFFSIWVEEKSLRENLAFYNIHAVKLRNLGQYSIKSREFAAAFRSEFAKENARWPNVAVDYGPQTLMQGSISIDQSRFHKQVDSLITEFVRLQGLIDSLLRERRRQPSFMD